MKKLAKTANTCLQLAEGLAARATVRRVGVVDVEPLLFDGIVEVDGRPLEVRDALAIDDEPDTIKLDDCIALFNALVEEELVLETRASTRVDCDSKTVVIAVFLCEKVLDLGCGIRGQDDTVRSGLRCFHTHDSNDTREPIPR